MGEEEEVDLEREEKGEGRREMDKRDKTES